MREQTLTLRARWTPRRTRRWWDLQLGRLVQVAAELLRVPLDALIFVEVENPGEYSRGRRKWVYVRVHVLYLVWAND